MCCAALLCCHELGINIHHLRRILVHLAVVGIKLGVLSRAGEHIAVHIGNDGSAVVDECTVALLRKCESEEGVLRGIALHGELARLHFRTVQHINVACGGIYHIHHLVTTGASSADVVFNILLLSCHRCCHKSQCNG